MCAEDLRDTTWIGHAIVYGGRGGLMRWGWDVERGGCEMLREYVGWRLEGRI